MLTAELKNPFHNHTEGIQLILKALVDNKIGVIKNLSEISAFGHRVVHGGEAFQEAIIITKNVIDDIKKCIPMAPLHNPANLAGIGIHG